MAASSVGVSYRPVRLGWCVRNNNWEDLRRALRLTHTLWGGRFNPVIPIENGIAEDLVNLYGVDVLFPVADEVPVKDFIAKFPWLPWPSFNDGLFVADGEGAVSTFLDIYHVVRHLVEQNAKRRGNATVSATQYAWDVADPLGDIFLAYFGSYPPKDEILKDYAELVNKNLRGKLVQLKTSDPLDPDALKALTPSVLTNHWIEWDSSPEQADGGVYVGQADDFEDVVNFWNLRAADAELIFYDPRHRQRLASFVESFVQPFSKRTTNEVTFEPQMSVWSKEGREIDLKEFNLDRILRCTASETTWNGFNLKPTRFHIGREKSAFGTITESGQVRELSLHLPEKPFFEEIEIHEQKVMVAISSIGLDLIGEESTFRVPFLPMLNNVYGRRMYRDSKKLRIGADRLGVIESIMKSHVNLRSVSKRELITEIFKALGMKTEVSAPGRIASRLIAQMGGIQSCRVFKIPGVRDLLEYYGPQTPFERSQALQKIGPHFSDYENLCIEPRESGPLRPEHVFTFLVKQGVFQVGLTFSCPHCELEPWIPLDDLATEVRCEFCGRTFLITPQLRDRNWKYRRSGLFGRDNNQEGSIPVVLTLMQLDTTLQFKNLFVTNMTIEPTAAHIVPCETDFVLIQQGYRDEGVSIAIGECKTRGEVSEDDVRKLALVADVFEESGVRAFVVFSKIEPFTADEVTRCRTAQSQTGLRVIMLTKRELETLYSVYERTEKEFVIDASAISLEDLAEATDQIYFHPRPRP